MLLRSLARSLQPLPHLSPPPTFAGPAFTGSGCVRALQYAVSVQHSTAAEPRPEGYAQARVTEPGAPRLLARPDAGHFRLGTGQSRAVGVGDLLVCQAQQAVWQQRCLACSADQPPTDTAAPDPLPPLHTPAQVTVSAESSGTEQGVRPAAEDALVSLLRSAPDVGALRQVLEQHSAQLQPDQLRAARHRLNDLIGGLRAVSTPQATIDAMAVFRLLQPHLCDYVASTETQSAAQNIRRALQVYSEAFLVTRYVAMGLSRQTGTAAERWQSEAGVYHNKHYQPAARRVIETCEAVLGVADAKMLLSELSYMGTDIVPRYYGVARAVSVFEQYHSLAPAAPRRRLCEAVLAAMGEHIRGNDIRVQSAILWQRKSYRNPKANDCLLLGLQRVMHGLGMPVGELWHTHLGDATLAALSACPPDQWSDGHMRLLAAWQQSGAAADTPVGTAIAQLAAQRSGQDSGQAAAAAGAVASAANQPAPAAAVAANSTTAAGAAVGAGSQPAAAAGSIQEPPAQAAARPDSIGEVATQQAAGGSQPGQPQQHTHSAHTHPATSASLRIRIDSHRLSLRPHNALTRTGTESASTDALHTLILKASDLTTLHTLLEQHRKELQLHHARAAWRRYIALLHAPTLSLEAVISGRVIFSLLQPFLCAYVTEFDTERHLRAFDVRSVLRAMSVYEQFYTTRGLLLKKSRPHYRDSVSGRSAQAETDPTQNRSDSLVDRFEPGSDRIFSELGSDSQEAVVREPLPIPSHIRTQYRQACADVVVTCESEMAKVNPAVLARQLGAAADKYGNPRFYAVAPAFVHFVRYFEGPGTKHRARVCEALLATMGRHIQDHVQDIPTRAVWQPSNYRVRTPGACLLLDIQRTMQQLKLPVGTLWAMHMGDATLLALTQCKPSEWSENHKRLLAAWEQAGVPPKWVVSRAVRKAARASRAPGLFGAAAAAAADPYGVGPSEQDPLTRMPVAQQADRAHAADGSAQAQAPARSWWGQGKPEPAAPKRGPVVHDVAEPDLLRLPVWGSDMRGQARGRAQQGLPRQAGDVGVYPRTRRDRHTEQNSPDRTHRAQDQGRGQARDGRSQGQTEPSKRGRRWWEGS